MGEKDFIHKLRILLKELRGFAPIGMLEYRNYGIMGSGEIDHWFTGKSPSFNNLL
jgi:hypothetical protein